MDDSFVARDKVSIIIIFGSSASVTRHDLLTQNIIPGVVPSIPSWLGATGLLIMRTRTRQQDQSFS
jgi:hypothetical protein